MNVKNLISCIVILPLIAACQSHPDQIGDIEVNVFGPMPDRAHYEGKATSIGNAFGAIGAGIKAAAEQGPAGRIENFVQAQNIDLRPVVLAELKHQLSERPRFSNRIKDNAASKLNIEITEYGIASGLLYHGYRPYLTLNMEMVDPSGKIVWHDDENVAQTGLAPGIAFDAFLVSPGAFRQEFSPAIRETVGLLLAKLDGPAPTPAALAPPVASSAPVPLSPDPGSTPPAKPQHAPPPIMRDSPVQLSPAQQATARPIAADAPVQLPPAAASQAMPVAIAPPSPPPVVARPPAVQPAPQNVSVATLPRSLNGRVPYLDDAHQIKFQEYLQKPKPRAFAISDNGHYAAVWGTEPSDAPNRALQGCRSAAGKECVLYAVDDVIVFNVE